MKPLVAVVGRPNVGKSTFFNRMIGERVAVVEDLPGTTRDRIYGDADWNGREFTLIDTGGLELGSDIPVGQVGLTGQPGDIMKHVKAQAELAIEEADVIVFMVDARSGISAADEEVADLLRRTEKPVILAANKADNAARRLDAIDTELLYKDRKLVLIDTAGIRRRGKVGPGIEKFSVLRSERAIERSDVALLLIDASEGLAAQDTHIAGEILEKAKGVVVVVNKWDMAQEQQRAERRGEYTDPKAEIESAEAYRRIIAEGLKFIPFAPIVFASAKTGYHVQSLLDTVLNVTGMRYLRVPTARLNEVVQDAVRRHNPTVVHSKILKIYYATQAQVNPPTFVFFVNDTQAVHFTYERYLENKIREAFSFKGTAIRLFFKPRPKNELK